MKGTNDVNRAEIAEFDDVTAPWTMDLSASDLRSAFTSECVLQSHEVEDGKPINVVVWLGGWRDALDKSGWKILERRESKDSFQPYRPLAGEIARARRLAAAHVDGEETPALQMYRRFWEVMDAPIVLREFEDSLSTMLPIVDQVCKVLGPEHLASYLIGSIAVFPDPISAAEAVGVRDEFIKSLRYVWLHIALSAPHLLQMHVIEDGETV